MLTDTPVRWTSTLDRQAEKLLKCVIIGCAMKKTLQATIGSVVLVAGLQSQAHANKLYDLNVVPPAANIVPTFDASVEIGFSFSLPATSGSDPPYEVTFNKIGFWVNTAANPAIYNATISLYDITNSTLPPPNQAQLLNQTIGNNIGTTCTLTGQFCFADLQAPITLVSGVSPKTYLLTSKYSDSDSNANTYYANKLAAPSQVSFINNVIYGNAWFDPNTLFSPQFNYGAFGPNLSGVVITGGPTPVPAPLPLLGAAAALTYSRKIKARIKISAG